MYLNQENKDLSKLKGPLEALNAAKWNTGQEFEEETFAWFDVNLMVLGKHSDDEIRDFTIKTDQEIVYNNDEKQDSNPQPTTRDVQTAIR